VGAFGLLVMSIPQTGAGLLGMGFPSIREHPQARVATEKAGCHVGSPSHIRLDFFVVSVFAEKARHAP